MKADFRPKFHQGEIRSIYFRRLLKKAARVGADADLVRRLETLVCFDRCEAAVGAREIEADVDALPASVRNAEAPAAEKTFVALCYDPAADLDWALYFGEPEETVNGLAEELELLE